MAHMVQDDPHRFEFDLDRAIGVQVIEKLEESPLLRLEKSIGPRDSGVYALYHLGKLVYIGKDLQRHNQERTNSSSETQ